MSPWLTHEECVALGIIADPTAKVSRGVVSMSASVKVGAYSRVDHGAILSGHIDIGRYCHVGLNAILQGKYGIAMADFSTISANSIIYTESDDFAGDGLIGPTVPEEFRAPPIHGAVSLGRAVSVGCQSTVMPCVDINDGACIGAHSFVPPRRVVEGWTIYAGVPIKARAQRQKAALVGLGML